mmetsp:Transcript_8126/g.20165  ORF Transcript_8126/g.20165 Transcript_8126/m.20165 type:complete len:112 (-) Transcript_8126:577-912(-)
MGRAVPAWLRSGLSQQQRARHGGRSYAGFNELPDQYKSEQYPGLPGPDTSSPGVNDAYSPLRGGAGSMQGYTTSKQSKAAAAAAAAAAGGVAGVDGAGGVLTFSTLIEAPT